MQTEEQDLEVLDEGVVTTEEVPACCTGGGGLARN